MNPPPLRQELIIKIKALIALSQDQSTTEAERLNAMRAAQRLLLKCSIIEADLTGNGLKEPEILTAKYTIRQPGLWENNLMLPIIAIISGNFGCYSYMNTKEHKNYIMGFKTNIEITIYAIDILLTQGYADYKKGQATHHTLSYRNDFWLGFQDGLRQRFAKMSNETGIELYDKVKEKWASFTTPINFNNYLNNEGAMKAGSKSASEASLHTGLTSNNPSSGGTKLIG